MGRKLKLKDCPELVAQLHPELNDMDTVLEKSVYSKDFAWWQMEYIEPITKKVFHLVWDAHIDKRYMGEGCPYLSGKRVCVGLNDLKSKAPELALQWHPTLNGDLKPTDVTYGSGKSVWWLLPYDDPKTGKHFDFVWDAKIYKRYAGEGCPYLSGKRIWIGYNDFGSASKELSLQWHPTLNGDKTPQNTFAKSNEPVWWIFDYDDPFTGKHFTFVWDASPAERLNSPGIPFLSGQRIWPGFNDLKTRNRKLAEQWNYEKNDDLLPENFMPNSKEEVWWIYPYDDPVTGKHFDFEWTAKITDRNNDGGVPFLTQGRVWVGFNDLVTRQPEIAKEWHPTRNRNHKPEDFTEKSNKKVWWLCPICGRSYMAYISHRTEGQQCKCQNKREV